MMKKVLSITIVLVLNLYSNAQVGNYQVSTYAGTGVGGYNGDGVAATNAQINNPYEIVTDDNNNVYFADQVNKRIRKIDAQTNIISTIVDYTNTTVNNPNFLPSFLEFANDAIYFVDDNKLFKFNISNNSVALIYNFGANNSSISYFTVLGDSIIYRSSSVQIDVLYNIEDVNPIIFSNYSSQNNSSIFMHINYNNILDLLIDKNGDILVLNNGVNGKEVIRLNQTSYQAEVIFNTNSLIFPEGIAVDSNNAIYIADQGGNKIYIYKNSSLSVFAGNGSAGYKDTIANSAMFDSPAKLAIDNNNKVYVSDNDNNRIRIITENCNSANEPEISFNYDNCPNSLTLTIIDSINNLNDNTEWVWYYDDCGVNQVSTGSTFILDAQQPQILYVRGEGGCSNPGICHNLLLNQLVCDSTDIDTKVIPTAFSPNGDGVNDVWIIDNILNNTSVSIYNRWGDLINKIDDYDNIDKVWDGTSKQGIKMPSGTYFYTIEKNNFKISSGWVEIVR